MADDDVILASFATIIAVSAARKRRWRSRSCWVRDWMLRRQHITLTKQSSLIFMKFRLCLPSVHTGDRVEFEFVAVDIVAKVEHVHSVDFVESGWFLSPECRTSFRLCHFPRLAVTKLVNTTFLKRMNRCRHKWSAGRGHETSTVWLRRSKVKVTRGWIQIWRPGGGIILYPLRRIDSPV